MKYRIGDRFTKKHTRDNPVIEITKPYKNGSEQFYVLRSVIFGFERNISEKELDDCYIKIS